MEDNTKWVTVLRDPAKHFRSLYAHIGWESRFKVDLHAFLLQPEMVFKLHEPQNPRIAGRNPMSYDLGLDARFFEVRDPIVNHFISVLDEQFDLVLISDYFDESLILLKELMCWTLHDIAYISQNVRSKDSIVETTLQDEEDAVREWNWADNILYQHFNRTLWEKLNAFGRAKLSEELKKLKRLKGYLEEDCIREKVDSGEQRMRNPAGDKVNNYRANPDAKDPYLCQQLCRPELAYLQKLRRMLDGRDSVGVDVDGQDPIIGPARRTQINSVDHPPLKSIKSESGNQTTNLTAVDVKNTRNETKPLGKEVKSSCLPLDAIAMIKTHKCSSSTLQNILLRRAEDHNVTVALPHEDVYFSPVFPFHRRFVFMDDGKQKYDILASNLRFNLNRFQDIEDVMKKDTKFVTILREPAAQYESTYSFCGFSVRFGVDLHTFLLGPQAYFEEKEPRHILPAGRNSMCYDNGLDARFLEPGAPAVRRFISSLDKLHDLVIIAEYFDESILLLKDIMCWELDDVVYFKQNARSNKSVITVTATDKEAIRKWNWADTLLYDHFNRTLWQKIAAYGEERMARDLTRLRARNEELRDDCVLKTLDKKDPRMWYPRGIQVNSFIPNTGGKNPHLCSQMTLPEKLYLQKLRGKRSKGG